MSSRDRARRLAPTVLVTVLVLALAAFAGGCGKKGLPLPPLRYVPAPTKDLAVQQRGSQLLLTFTYPKTTPAGAALTSVTSVEVWEVARPAPPPAATPAPSTPAKAPSTTPTTSATPSSPTMTPTAGAPTPTAQPSVTPPTPKPATPTTPTTTATPPTPGATPTPAVGAPSVPPPPAALPGGFPPLDARELEAMAKLKLKLQGPEVAAATSGDKLVIMLPLPEPPPAAAATPEKPASGTKAAATAKPAAGSAPPATAASAPAAPTVFVHYYAIRAYGPKNDRSAFSNQTALIPKPPPPPPGEVKVTGKAEGIEVSWTEPAAPAASPAPAASQAPAATQKILGFNIYRRDASAKTFGAPVRAALPDARSIVDVTARFGESYIYGVAAITEAGPLVESAIQSEVEIKYVDRYPPPVPADVVALAEAGKVRVVWRASAAADLAGYLVSRREGPAGAWKKLTETPIPDVQYLDGGVANGATYTYRVTAVDRSGNESAPGEAQTKVQ